VEGGFPSVEAGRVSAVRTGDTSRQAGKQNEKELNPYFLSPLFQGAFLIVFFSGTMFLERGEFNQAQQANRTSRFGFGGFCGSMCAVFSGGNERTELSPLIRSSF